MAEAKCGGDAQDAKSAPMLPSVFRPSPPPFDPRRHLRSRSLAVVNVRWYVRVCGWRKLLPQKVSAVHYV